MAFKEKPTREFIFTAYNNRPMAAFGPVRTIIQDYDTTTESFLVEGYPVSPETFEAAKTHNMICYGILPEPEEDQ